MNQQPSFSGSVRLVALVVFASLFLVGCGDGGGAKTEATSSASTQPRSSIAVADACKVVPVADATAALRNRASEGVSTVSPDGRQTNCVYNSLINPGDRLQVAISNEDAQLALFVQLKEEGEGMEMVFEDVGDGGYCTTAINGRSTLAVIKGATVLHLGGLRCDALLRLARVAIKRV